MSEIDRIEVAITADPSSAVSGFQKASQAAQDFDSKIKSVGSSDFGDKVQGESEQAVTGLKKAEDAADSLSSKLKNLDIGSGLSGISKISGGLADGMQKVGLAATAVGVPVGLLAKNSISMFADLESQTQRNTALLGGAKAEYEEILALSKELGASTPFDALEIGAGIESLAAAGYSLNEIKSAMPTVAEMAIATGEDLSSMSEILIATLSSYGEGADKAAMYGDKLATVANISSAGIGDFGESMKYVGAVANAFGVDIDELGASIATLADNNLKGSLAGTGLREIITTLVNPTAKVKDIFESFGLTMDELNPKTNDFVDIMKKMKDANVSSEAMMAAFGDRAGPAAVILLEQIDKLKENYSTLLTESDGMLKEFSGKMRDTLGFVMDEMGGTIGNIMIEIGAGLKPIVQEMGKWLNENQQTLIDFAKNAVEGLTPFVEKFLGLAEKLMDWFNGLPKDMQSKIAGLTGLGAAMATIGGPLLLLGSLPVRAISDVTGALAGLFTVAKGAGAGAGLGGLIGDIGGLGGAAGGAIPNLTALFGPAGILAVGLGAGALAAYATNFGDFRDNINSTIGELGEAASNISTGDFEAAGRDCAEAFGKGLETIGDLTVATITGIPDAVTVLNEFKAGFDTAAGDIVEGFTGKLTTDLYAGITSIKIPPLGHQTIFTKEMYAENLAGVIDDIKSSFANIDLSSAGKSMLVSLFSSSTLKSVLEGAFKGTFVTVSNLLLDDVAKKFGLTPKEIQSMLKGQGPMGIGDKLGEWYGEANKKDTSEPQSAINRYYQDLIAKGITPTFAKKQAETQYYQNRAAHSGEYLKPDDLVTGTQTGLESAAPVIAEQTGKSVAEALAKEKGWYDRGKVDTQMAEEFLRKNPNYDTSRFTEAAEETTKKTKSSGEKIVKSLEELRTEAYNKDQDSFTFEDTKYKWDDAAGDYIKWTKAESMAAERAKEQEKATKAAIKSQEKFIGSFEAGLNPQKVADTLYDKYGSDALNGKEFQIGDLLYKISQTQSGGIKTSGTNEATKKIIDALNVITTNNDKISKELSKETKTNKKGEVSGGPDQSKIADYNNEIKAAQAILNKYGVSQTKGIESTDELNSSLGKTAASTSELDKSVTDTSDNLTKFSEPVETASGNVFTFSDAVSVATGTLAELGTLDIKSIVEKWLTEGEIGEAQQRKAEDLGALYGKDMATSLTAGVAQQIAKEMPNWLKWQKENKGQSYEDLSQDKSALWYEIANTVLKSNYAGYSDPGTRDWTFRKYVDDRLNSDTQTIIDGLFQKSLDKFVKPFYGMESQSLPGAKTSVGQLNELDSQLDKYNKTASTQSKTTYEMESALKMASVAQTMYTTYMEDGKLTADEASHIQQALAASTKDLGDAGIKTADDIAKLPTALQGIATSIVDFINSLKATASEALNSSLASDGWRTATNSSYESMVDPKTGKPVQRSYLDIDVILGLKDGTSKVESLTRSNELLKNSIFANIGTTDLLSTAYQNAGTAAVQTMDMVTAAASSAISRAQALAAAAQAAMSQIQSAIAMANAQITNVRKVGDWTLQTMSGLPKLQNSNTVDFNNWLKSQGQLPFFASGGPVTQNGPAMLHQGEYVLRRDEVNRPTSGSPNVNLNINMSNSRFGNSEMQKDLPKRIARETRRALARSGI